MRRRAGSRQKERRRSLRSRLVIVGTYGCDLLLGASLFTMLLLIDGMTAALVALVPLLSNDIAFLRLAEFMHIFLMAADGFLFILAVLYLVVRAIRGGGNEP